MKVVSRLRAGGLRFGDWKGMESAELSGWMAEDLVSWKRIE